MTSKGYEIKLLMSI